MKKNWKVLSSEKREERIFPELEKITERVLINRGIETKEQKESFLSPDYETDLHDPFLLSDIDKAVDRVLEARKKEEKVCVFGDYDADGVTSSVVLKDIFDQLEIENFCYIPERNKEGYGINKEAIDCIQKQGADLIVTIDCGVSNFEEVEYAKELGIDVVITDHHHVPPKLPNAVAVVNPKKRGDKYPEKELAGVGIAFKFVQALTSKVEDFDKEQLKWLLDLVAIGTIADCVPLFGENRTLVKFGLIVLSKTRRVGLKQLFHVGRIPIDERKIPTSHQVGFQIAPRINAAGRIDHANLAYNLLCSKKAEEAQARVLALEIEDKNKHRQNVTKEIAREIGERMLEKKETPKIIIESSPHWSLGVVGLAAGQVQNKYNRPTFLLEEGEETFRGSGRSNSKFNLIETLEKHGDLFVKYGGHSKAAGLEIKKERLPEFKKAIADELKDLSEEDLIEETEIDQKIKISEINEKLLSELNLLEPFGHGNKKPIFLSEGVIVESLRLVGNGEKHLKLMLQDSEDKTKKIDAIGFGLVDDNQELKVGDKINAIYNLEENIWNGNKNAQAVIVDLEIV